MQKDRRLEEQLEQAARPAFEYALWFSGYGRFLCLCIFVIFVDLNNFQTSKNGWQMLQSLKWRSNRR